MLAEDDSSVDDDIEDAARSALEFDIGTETLLEFRRETRGAGFVVSDPTIVNTYLHGSSADADTRRDPKLGRSFVRAG